MKKKIIFIILLFLIIIGGATVFLLYQYTELFEKKLIPLKVQGVELQYVPGYDIGTVEQLNATDQTVIEIQKISLKDEDLNNIKKEFRKIKKSSSKNEELYEVQYRLVVNDKITLKIGDGVGDIQKENQYTSIIVPKSTLKKLDQITSKNNEKILKKISSENVTAKLDGASITIKNKDNLEYINDYLNYYPIQINADYKEYDGGYKIILILDNDVKVYLINDRIGYISQKENDTDTSTYGVFTNNLYDLINDIYKTSVE